MLHNVVQDSIGWRVGEQEASCQALAVTAMSHLSGSIAKLHVAAVDAVVLAGIDHCSWHSSRKPMTWPEAPG